MFETHFNFVKNMYGGKIRTWFHSSVILALNSFFVSISKCAVSHKNSTWQSSVFLFSLTELCL